MIYLSYTYRPFEIEKAIALHYKRIGITTPSEIDLELIARSFGIFLSYKEKRSFAFEQGRFKMINIDVRIPICQQREQFFHELCHLLRHYGSQLILPKAFIELQEFDARRFTKYASMPYNMVSQFNLSNCYIIKEMAESFRVRETLVTERLEGIYRNSDERRVIYC